MATALGKIESQLFAYVQMRGLQTVRTGELLRALDITPQQERELLSRLARRSLIVRVRRGLYLVPPRLPPGGKWSPSEFQAITALIKDQGGRYQVCGPSAFYHYGWDNQIPNRLYAYNNLITGERTIGSVAMTLVKITNARLGETEVAKTPDDIDAIYCSRVRSLVDAIYDWSRFNSLPQGYGWIRSGRITICERQHAPPTREAARTGRREGLHAPQAGAQTHAVFCPNSVGTEFGEAGHSGSAMGGGGQL
jgi:hypothetical protein